MPPLHRLRQVPFWEEVFYAERRAGAIVAAFTETVTDPVLKAALALQGQEETRHANLIRVMIDRYGLDAPERPIEDFGTDIETSFKDFGFGECLELDSWVSACSRSRGNRTTFQGDHANLLDVDVRGNAPASSSSSTGWPTRKPARAGLHGRSRRW